jgi:hypothetical protein
LLLGLIISVGIQQDSGFPCAPAPFWALRALRMKLETSRRYGDGPSLTLCCLYNTPVLFTSLRNISIDMSQTAPCSLFSCDGGAERQGALTGAPGGNRQVTGNYVGASVTLPVVDRRVECSNAEGHLWNVPYCRPHGFRILRDLRRGATQAGNTECRISGRSMFARRSTSTFDRLCGAGFG